MGYFEIYTENGQNPKKSKLAENKFPEQNLNVEFFTVITKNIYTKFRQNRMKIVDSRFFWKFAQNSTK